MSIADFTAHDACVALAAIIKTAVADPAVMVLDGLPAEEPTLHERIYITDILALVREPYTTHGASHERYDLALAIEVVSFDTYVTTRGRAWALLNTVHTAIDQDPTLGGVVSRCTLSHVDRQATRPHTSGWYADLIARVSVEALRA